MGSDGYLLTKLFTRHHIFVITFIHDRVVVQGHDHIADLFVDALAGVTDVVAVAIPWVSVVPLWTIVTEIVYKNNNN